MTTADDIVRLASELGERTGKPTREAFGEYKEWLKEKGYNRSKSDLSLKAFDCAAVDEFVHEKKGSWEY